MANRVSTTGPGQQTVSTPSQWRSPSALLTMFAVGCCVILTGVVLFGRVQGTEFCPQTFSLREYTFFRAPMTDWQITPVVRDVRTTGFILRLRKDGYVGSLKGPTRWDVVEVQDGGQRSTGMAQVLVDYLESGPDRASDTWSVWTSEHPELAKRFWPIVQQAVCVQAYAVLPTLFSAAANRSETDDALELSAFTEELVRVLVDQVNELARDTAAAGEKSKAISMYELTLGHVDSAAIRREYRALGGSRTTADLQAYVAAMPLIAQATGPAEVRDSAADGSDPNAAPDEVIDFESDAESTTSRQAADGDTDTDAEVISREFIQP